MLFLVFSREIVAFLTFGDADVSVGFTWYTLFVRIYDLQNYYYHYSQILLKALLARFNLELFMYFENK